MRLLRLIGAALVAAAAACITATPAAAHARLVRTDPAAGSTVAANLAAVALEFDDNVKLLPRALLVTGATGAPLTTAAPRIVGGHVLEVALLDRLVPGRYYVGWRVLSDDGHVVSGSFDFNVGGVGAALRPAFGAPAETTTPLPTPGQPIWPVIVAAALAAVAIGGAAVAVHRGLRAIRLTPADAYPPMDAVGRGASANGDVTSRH